MTDKYIRKIYKNFLTEKVESSRKDILCILIWALILGGFSYWLSIHLSNLIKDLVLNSIKSDWIKEILQKVPSYLQLKLENDNIRLYSSIIFLLNYYYGLLSLFYCLIYYF